MSRVLEALCLVWLAAVLLFSAYWCLRPVLKSGCSCGHRELSCFYDFSLRMNEAECLRQGVDPYDVWIGKIRHPPYYAHHLESASDNCDKMTNAYVPWEYSLALPLSVLPRWMGWLVYCGLMLLAATSVVLLSQNANLCLKSHGDLLPSLAALSLVVYPLWSNAAIGNLSVFSLLGAIGMAWSLNRGKDVLAGCFWSLAMLKPQLGLPFAVPLLLRLRWKTMVTAVAACVFLSIPPSLLCGKSFVGMILHAPKASAFAFEGCGTWPRFLCGAFGNEWDIVIGVLVGSVVCLVMTWLVRGTKCWFEFLMPAAIVSCSWTYTQSYSHAMGWFVAFVLVQELVRSPHSKFLWVLMAAAVFSLPRWLLMCHGLFVFCGWTRPLSDYAFGCMNSLNSTLSLAVAIALCSWMGRRLKREQTNVISN